MNTNLPIPKKGLEFNKGLAKAWIKSENDSEIKSIKAKIIENIKHISFNEFKTKSEAVTKEALKYIAKNKEKYIVFFDYKPHSSKRWVYELNKSYYLENPPSEIGHFTPTWEKISGNKRLHRLVENNINTFLIIDDAAYSGEQIAHRQIEPIIKFYEESKIIQKPKFILAIPFVTNRFLKLIEDLKYERGYEVILFNDSIMLKLKEVLNREEIKILQSKRFNYLNSKETEPDYLNSTITYFDHHVADSHSFYYVIKKVLNLNAIKTYSEETCNYFKEEELEFENYKNVVFPNKNLISPFSIIVV